MNTSDILNKAADLIEQRGWSQASGWISGDDTERLCLEGGIQAAAGGLRRHDYDETFQPTTPLFDCPAYKAVDAYLSQPNGERLYYWNDEPGRTASEVVEVLRACAVIESSRERETAAVS